MTHNGVNTFLGALIAAAVLLISSLTALFQQDPELTFGAISQATWVSVVGGTVVAFLKDFQAVRTRQLLGKVTGASDE